jgi:carboxymethylenebutenolidase
MVGSDGREEVHEFYAKYFLPQIPPDAEIVRISRAIGQERLVDEMIFRVFPSLPRGARLPILCAKLAPSGMNSA